MNKEYYIEYSELEKTHWWFRARMNILSSIVKMSLNKDKTDKLKILNIGVATGQTTRMLEQFGTVTSLEFDEDCCEYLRSKAGIDAIQGSVTDLPMEDNYYDLACAFDVIEHVEDDRKAIDEISRVLKTDGSIIVTVPAYMFLWSEHDVINKHFRRYTSRKLKQLIEPKFDIKYRSYFNFILFPIILVARIFGRLTASRTTKKNEVKSDFEYYKTGEFLNNIFYSIFNSEKRFIGKMSIPFGVSIICFGKKQPI